MIVARSYTWSATSRTTFLLRAGVVHWDKCQVSRDGYGVTAPAPVPDLLLVDDAESELRDQLTDDEYIDVMNALGITPEIDLASV